MKVYMNSKLIYDYLYDLTNLELFPTISFSHIFLSESLSMENLPEVWKVEVKQKSLISESFSNERDR